MNDHTRTATIEMLTRRQEGIEGVSYYDLRVSKREARAVIKEFAKENLDKIMMGMGNTITEVRANMDHQRGQESGARMRRIAEGKE